MKLLAVGFRNRIILIPFLYNIQEIYLGLMVSISELEIHPIFIHIFQIIFCPYQKEVVNVMTVPSDMGSIRVIEREQKIHLSCGHIQICQ